MPGLDCAGAYVARVISIVTRLNKIDLLRFIHASVRFECDQLTPGFVRRQSADDRTASPRMHSARESLAGASAWAARRDRHEALSGPRRDRSLHAIPRSDRNLR